MNGLFTFLLTVLLITGIGGCYKCVKNDYYVDIDQMQVAAQQSNYGNTLQENLPIKYDSLIIMTYFSDTWYTNAENNSQLSFLPVAIARDDCDPGMKGSKETI